MTTTPDTRLPHPAARMFVRQVIGRYPLGLAHGEARRRCSRGGVIYTVDSTGRNITEPYDEVLEHLLAAGIIEQRVIGRGVRLIDSKYPTTSTADQEDSAS